jgi:hypothetical protein
MMITVQFLSAFVIFELFFIMFMLPIFVPFDFFNLLTALCLINLNVFGYILIQCPYFILKLSLLTSRR